MADIKKSIIDHIKPNKYNHPLNRFTFRSVSEHCNLEEKVKFFHFLNSVSLLKTNEYEYDLFIWDIIESDADKLHKLPFDLCLMNWTTNNVAYNF